MQRTTAKFCRFTYRHIIQNIILFKRFGILFLTVLLDVGENKFPAGVSYLDGDDDKWANSEKMNRLNLDTVEPSVLF